MYESIRNKEYFSENQILCPKNRLFGGVRKVYLYVIGMIVDYEKLLNGIVYTLLYFPPKTPNLLLYLHRGSFMAYFLVQKIIKRYHFIYS